MKKLFSILFAVLLFAAFTVSAAAADYTQGIALTAEEQENIDTIADAIFTQYGVQAYFLYQSDLPDGTLADYTIDFADSVDDSAIIFTVSADSYYLYVSDSAAAKTVAHHDDQDALYEACRAADERGEYYNMAVQYYAALNALLADRASFSSYADPALTSQNDSYGGSRVIDEADLLSEAERVALQAKLDEISERQQFDVIVYTMESFPGNELADYAEAWYDASDFGFGQEKDGCLLTLSMEARDWSITSTGFGETALNPDAREYVFNLIQDDLHNGKYADAFNCFADQTDALVTQAKDGNPYKAPIHYGKRIIMALLIGLAVSGIVTLSVKNQYKPVRKKTGAADYMVPGSLQVTGSYDRFMYNNVTRIKKSSSSSSGGGVHTSSSGRSSSGKF